MRHINQRRKFVSGAVVVALAATAGVASAHNAKYPGAKFKHPQLKRGMLIVNGTRASDKIALRLKAGDVNIVQIDVGDNGVSDFSFPRNAIAEIAVNASGGDDAVRIDDSNGSFTDSIPTTIDGGDGADTIAGGKGVETLRGGNGDDTIDGNGGNDAASLGAGDDTFVWDPGDGSDTIEGDRGTDTLRFNGAGADEQVTLSANGARLKFFRVQANITMDTAGVERVDFNALGGADLVTVNDLGPTDVTDVRVDLAGALGGATGDGQADHVVVNGTDGEDAFVVNGDAGGVKTSRLATTVGILHPEAGDRLDVNTLAGRDSVDAAGLAVGTLQLFVDGALVP